MLVLVSFFLCLSTFAHSREQVITFVISLRFNRSLYDDLGMEISFPQTGQGNLTLGTRLQTLINPSLSSTSHYIHNSGAGDCAGIPAAILPEIHTPDISVCWLGSCAYPYQSACRSRLSWLPLLLLAEFGNLIIKRLREHLDTQLLGFFLYPFEFFAGRIRMCH